MIVLVKIIGALIGLGIAYAGWLANSTNPSFANIMIMLVGFALAAVIIGKTKK